MSRKPTQPTTVSSSLDRRRQIMTLIRTRKIPTQEALVAALRQQGLEVTQATVSRDLRELGVLRVHEHGTTRYVPGSAEIDQTTANSRLTRTFRDYVESMEFVDYIGVIHTQPGTGSLVASAIDGARFDAVAGTVAGDDTVIVIARSRPAAQRLARDLEAAGAE